MHRPARHEVLRLRDLNAHIIRWGPPPKAGHPPLFLLHGYLDAGVTFQFLADHLAQDRPLVAVDWRGFGASGWASGGYWFPDYLADLDALLDVLCPAEPASLLGHSMGGNIAAIYAGTRPERVRLLVNLEGIGLPATSSDLAPSRYGQWLEQIRAPRTPKSYGSFDELAAVILARYPQFGAERAMFVANAWAIQHADGRVRLRSDPLHRRANPILYRREEAEACWRRIKAPVLMLYGANSEVVQRMGAPGTDESFRQCIPHLQSATIEGVGHMMHLERPEFVAPVVEAFLRTH
jgi:pimeloyl-ACP methyl ester carboxylesterase